MSHVSADRRMSLHAWGWIICLGALSLLGGATGCVSSRYTQSAAERSDDYATSSRISTALAGDPQREYFEGVKVETFKNVIQLSGFVNTDDLKSRAGNIAKGAAAGRDIRNNITVKK